MAAKRRCSANASGSSNSATGSFALRENTTGIGNVATGFNALASNITGFGNVATGAAALANSSTGDDNVASVDQCLVARRGCSALVEHVGGVGALGRGSRAAE